MEATYDETRWSARDELRALFRDDEVTPGTTALEDAVKSDLLYDNILSSNGLREGAVKIALVYASYWVQEARKYANTQSGTSVEFAERAKFYQELSESIRTGKVVLGAGAPQRGAVLVGG